MQIPVSAQLLLIATRRGAPLAAEHSTPRRWPHWRSARSSRRRGVRVRGGHRRDQQPRLRRREGEGGAGGVPHAPVRRRGGQGRRRALAARAAQLVLRQDRRRLHGHHQPHQVKFESATTIAGVVSALFKLACVVLVPREKLVTIKVAPRFLNIITALSIYCVLMRGLASFIPGLRDFGQVCASAVTSTFLSFPHSRRYECVHSATVERMPVRW
jgi:hypothetical protein